MRLRYILFALAITGTASTGSMGADGWSSIPQNMELQQPKVLYIPPQDSSVLPYTMNYTDEAAQSLGIKNGRVNLFSTQPLHNDGLASTISGGINRNGAMLELQWHPGER